MQRDLQGSLRCRQVQHIWNAIATWQELCTGTSVQGMAWKSKWEIPPIIMWNDKAKILWDFQIQTNKLANQQDIEVVDKLHKKGVVIDVSIPNYINIKEKEHEKLKKQGLKEEVEKVKEVMTQLGL